MRTKKKPAGTTAVWWAMLTAISKSMQNRPVAWLFSVWVIGWAIYAWHFIHPASWDAVWGVIINTISQARRVSGSGKQAAVTAVTWLHEIGQWGQIALYASSVLLALYICYALWVWRQYLRVWMPGVRMERLSGGHVLEVIIPKGSKADARAAADMFAQLSTLLSERARTGGTRGTGGTGGKGGTGIQGGSTLHRPHGSTFRPGNIEAERLAVSLEMWSTPHSGGKVGFYIWCPNIEAGHRFQAQRGRNGVTESKKSKEYFTEEIRHLVMVHYPRCRVRWVEDPLKRALAELTQENSQQERGAVPERAATSNRRMGLTWYELTLRADSCYPISSGAAGERLSKGTRALSRPGAPGAGTDPLAAVIGMLGSDKELPLMGFQIVAAAHPGRVGEVQRSVSKELARLRDMEMRAGKKAVGPQHEARVLALEEKGDKQGYDVAIRLAVVGSVEAASSTQQQGHAAGEGSVSVFGGKAEARLESLLRIFKQYDRSVAGISQGFEVIRKEQVSLNASGSFADSRSPASVDLLKRMAPLAGRWTREGVCLPLLLSFMRMGRPSILNTIELSAIYHFPHQGLEGLASLGWKSYRHIPPPAMTHVTEEQLAKGQQIVLGVLDDDLAPEAGDAKIDKAYDGFLPLQEKDPAETVGPRVALRAVPGANMLPPGTRGIGTYFDDLRRGTYVLGPMGSGKSVFLYNIITQYMKAGRGVGIIDGKGDSYHDVLQLVPSHLEGEVLTFDPENRAGSVRGGKMNMGGAGRGGKDGRGGRGGRSIGIPP